jgi:hypothetical protein
MRPGKEPHPVIEQKQSQPTTTTGGHHMQRSRVFSFTLALLLILGNVVAVSATDTIKIGILGPF